MHESDSETPIQLDYLLQRTPTRFANATLAGFQTPTTGLKLAKDRAEEWARYFDTDGHLNHRGIFLTGPVGVGKTHIAYACGLWLARRYHSVGAISVSRYFANVKGMMGTGERIPTPDSVTLDFCRHPWELLILDDLGVERPSDWLLEQIYLLVDAAYTRQVALIVTSNLSYKELAERLGERTVSRVVALTEKIEVPGDDWRKLEAKAARS